MIRHLLLCLATVGLVACGGGGGSPGSSTPLDPATQTKAVAMSLVAVAENSQTTPAYGYAENINDGRGITFGIIGFTTGTYDGNQWLKHYTSLNPGNRLAHYIPALDAIDAGPHPDGLSANVTGLAQFEAQFQASVNDPHFKQAQIDKMDELYWRPSQLQAYNLGAKLPLTQAQLFDASVQMGTDGMADLVNRTNTALGGSPASGVNEVQWLTRFLEIRYQESLLHWAGTEDRVAMYTRLLKAGHADLSPPVRVSCYGDSFTITGREASLPL